MLNQYIEKKSNAQPRKQLSVKVETHAAIAELAEENDLTLTDVIDALLDFYDEYRED